MKKGIIFTSGIGLAILAFVTLAPVYNPPSGSEYAPGGTDVAIADGGTGASTALGALVNLGALKSVAATAHSFVVGDLLRMNGTAYVKARADSGTNAEVVGMVASVTDANNFILATGGFVSGLSGLTAGATYFLDPATAGAMTATEPTTDGQISKPVFIATTTTSGYFFNMRGAEIGAGTADYLVYTALLTQSGTDAPVATVLQNQLSGPIVFSYAGTGSYQGTLAGAFPAGKTPTLRWVFAIDAPVSSGVEISRTDDDNISITVIRNLIPADSRLSDTFIEIRVYP